jgi:phosphoserine phosphatase
MPVVIHFDREAALVDEVEFMVERLGTPEWCELRAGRDRHPVVAAWESVAADEATVRAVAAQVPVDPGFRPRVEALRAAGTEVVVVSDGFGLVVERACAGLDVEVRSNHVDFATGRLELRG